MYTFWTVAFLLICFFLIGIILLQQGKGADIGAAFGGGGGSGTIFGPQGAGNILTKATAGAGVGFFVLAIWLGRIGASGDVESLIPVDESDTPEATSTSAPGDDLDVEALEEQLGAPLDANRGLPTEVEAPPAEEAEEPVALDAPVEGAEEPPAPTLDAPAEAPAAPIDASEGLPTEVEAPAAP